MEDPAVQTKTNKREDKYGGSDEARFLLLKEVLERCMKEFPASRIGGGVLVSRRRRLRHFN